MSMGSGPGSGGSLKRRGASTIPTPSPRLDGALGGGWPVGGIIEIYGSSLVAAYLLERLDYTTTTTTVAPDKGHDSLQAALLHLHVPDSVVVLRQPPVAPERIWRDFLEKASLITQRLHATLFVYSGSKGVPGSGIEDQADVRVELSTVRRRQGSFFQALVLRAGSGRPPRSVVWKP